ncbi:hypothetical protein pdam_00014189 [Pocillopora damicornis]|uniref:Uncharacterized protein n=1 Tax=Pocillopora damicornis TaxID=46731 RepID=A0A3M6V4W8_POCDA|nr:hypothetical protein pdam_00014189 [Pocillopora damicornis]
MMLVQSLRAQRNVPVHQAIRVHHAKCFEKGVFLDKKPSKRLLRERGDLQHLGVVLLQVLSEIREKFCTNTAPLSRHGNQQICNDQGQGVRTLVIHPPPCTPSTLSLPGGCLKEILKMRSHFTFPLFLSLLILPFADILE